MPETPRKPPKQYAPVTLGEPFNPKSAEGHHRKQRQAAAIRYRKEREAEEAELEALAAAREAEIAARSPLRKFWDRLRGQ